MDSDYGENRIEELKRDVMSKIMEKRPSDCTLNSDDLKNGFQRAFESIIFHNPCADEIEQVKQAIRNEGVSEAVAEEHERILSKINDETSLMERKIIMVGKLFEKMRKIDFNYEFSFFSWSITYFFSKIYPKKWSTNFMPLFDIIKLLKRHIILRTIK